MLTVITVILLITFGATLMAQACSRSAKLARIAKLNGARFDNDKETVTTLVTAEKLEFCVRFYHRFLHVFTYSDRLAFTRVADDEVYTEENPKTPAHIISLFSAELKLQQFPTLKLVSRGSAFEKSSLPACQEIDKEWNDAFCFYAPEPSAAKFLTPSLLRLLKHPEKVYLELYDNALIYHEYRLFEPEDVEMFRFRAMQVLTELAKSVRLQQQPADQAQETAAESAEQNADVILASLSGTAERPKGPSQGWRMMWLFGVLILFLGISFLSWFALNNWIHM